jgi:hypothetical protein
MMGPGQRNRAEPPTWIQLSPVFVNVFKQLKRGALLLDPITLEMIHTMGALLWTIQISIRGGTDFSTQATYGVKLKLIYISGAAS